MHWNNIKRHIHDGYQPIYTQILWTTTQTYPQQKCWKMKLYTELSTLSTDINKCKTVYSCTPMVAMQIIFLEKINKIITEKIDIL